jgi:hypothetical protein
VPRTRQDGVAWQGPPPAGAQQCRGLAPLVCSWSGDGLTSALLALGLGRVPDESSRPLPPLAVWRSHLYPSRIAFQRSQHRHAASDGTPPAGRYQEVPCTCDWPRASLRR